MIMKLSNEKERDIRTTTHKYRIETCASTFRAFELSAIIIKIQPGRNEHIKIMVNEQLKLLFLVRKRRKRKNDYIMKHHSGDKPGQLKIHISIV